MKLLDRLFGSTLPHGRISDDRSGLNTPRVSETRHDPPTDLLSDFKTGKVKSDFTSDGKLTPETRAEDISWSALRGGIDTGSVIVNPRLAENLSTVLACISAISSAMASLPAYVYRTEGDARTIDETHPIARLIANGPNQHQTWSDFVEFIMASVLLRGNGLAEIVIDGRGAVVGLKPVPWEWCSVQMLPSGRLVYDIVELEHIYGGTGRPRRLLQDEVLHLRDRSDDGLIGRSRLQRAAAVVTGSLQMQETQSSFYEKGMSPSGVVELPENVKLAPEAKQVARSSLQDLFRGPSRAGKVLILDQGGKWKALSIDPESAQFLESRRLAVEELARLFGVPPPVIGDLTNGTFTNSETVLRWFAQTTLTYWIKKLETEFSRSVFVNGSRHLEIDLSGLLRGAPQERWAAWKIAVDAKILDPDEIRIEEGFGPRVTAGA